MGGFSWSKFEKLRDSPNLFKLISLKCCVYIVLWKREFIEKMKKEKGGKRNEESK